MLVDRPRGVTILAALAALSGVVPIAYGIISVIGAAATWLSTAETSAIPVLVMAIWFLAVGVAWFAVAWGFVTLARWAWLVGVVVTGVAVVTNVIAALAGNVGWPQAIVASVLPGIVLVYLFRSDIRAAFGR
jgi:hypothetical protein